MIEILRGSWLIGFALEVFFLFSRATSSSFVGTMSSIPLDGNDPYAPRSTSNYYQSSESGSSSSSRSSSSSSRSSGSSSASSSSSSSRPRPAAAATVSDEEEEPLFGGRPFRDSHASPQDQEQQQQQYASTSQSAGRPPNESAPDSNTFTTNEAQDKDGLYAILNVERDATEDKIKEAYRALASE